MEDSTAFQKSSQESVASSIGNLIPTLSISLSHQAYCCNYHTYYIINEIMSKFTNKIISGKTDRNANCVA